MDDKKVNDNQNQTPSGNLQEKVNSALNSTAQPKPEPPAEPTPEKPSEKPPAEPTPTATPPSNDLPPNPPPPPPPMPINEDSKEEKEEEKPGENLTELKDEKKETTPSPEITPEKPEIGKPAKMQLSPKTKKTVKIGGAILSFLLLLGGLFGANYLVKQRAEQRTQASCPGAGTSCEGLSGKHCNTQSCCVHTCKSDGTWDNGNSCGNLCKGTACWDSKCGGGEDPDGPSQDDINQCHNKCKADKKCTGRNENCEKNEFGIKCCECAPGNHQHWPENNKGEKNYDQCVCDGSYEWKNGKCEEKKDAPPCDGQTCVKEYSHGPDATPVTSTYIFACRKLKCTCEGLGDNKVLAERCSPDNSSHFMTEQKNGKVNSLCNYKSTIEWEGQEIDCHCFAWQVDWQKGEETVGWKMDNASKSWDKCFGQEENLACDTLTRNPTGELNENDMLTLTCSHSGSGFHHYNYRYTSTINEGWQEPEALKELPGTANYQITNNLPDNVTYQFQCQACDAGNNCGTWGENNCALSFTLDQPDTGYVCTDLTSAQNTDDSMNLTCAGLTLNTNFTLSEFQYTEDGGANWESLGSPTPVVGSSSNGLANYTATVNIDPENIPAGDWAARCRFCVDQNNCTPWHQPPAPNTSECSNQPDGANCTNGLCLNETCCTGCITGNVCYSGQTLNACGINGADCQACGASGQTCISGVCN